MYLDNRELRSDTKVPSMSYVEKYGKYLIKKKKIKCSFHLRPTKALPFFIHSNTLRNRNVILERIYARSH